VKLGTMYGVGVGPGDPGLLTLRAVEVLCRVQVVFAATGAHSQDCISGSVVDAVPGCQAERVTLVFSMAREMEDRRQAWSENAEKVADVLRQGKDCAFATIGDPLIYSTYTYLLRQVRELLPEVKVETIPGITSFQTVAARNNLPLVEREDVKLHRSVYDELIVRIGNWKRNVALPLGLAKLDIAGARYEENRLNIMFIREPDEDATSEELEPNAWRNLRTRFNNARA